MLQEQITADLTAAMKEKNEVALSALRNLKSAVKNAEIEKGDALNDDDVRKVIAKKVKQHKDSIESFKLGSREDLADIEKAQMAVLQKYLPGEMTEEELRQTVKDIIDVMNANLADFGKVMKEVVTKIEGRADGKVVSKIVKEELK